jgi:hypothetical protein
MKYWIIGILVLSVATLSDAALAKKNKPVSKESDSHSTCVYNYMACRDQCDYFQDKSQIDPCKAKCDRSYGCRPAKVTRPVDKDPN